MKTERAFETFDLGGRSDSVQCSVRDLKVVSWIQAHGSFLVRGVALLLTLT